MLEMYDDINHALAAATDEVDALNVKLAAKEAELDRMKRAAAELVAKEEELVELRWAMAERLRQLIAAVGVLVALGGAAASSSPLPVRTGGDSD